MRATIETMQMKMMGPIVPKSVPGFVFFVSCFVFLSVFGFWFSSVPGFVVPSVPGCVLLSVPGSMLLTLPAILRYLHGIGVSYIYLYMQTLYIRKLIKQNKR